MERGGKKCRKGNRRRNKGRTQWRQERNKRGKRKCNKGKTK